MKNPTKEDVVKYNQTVEATLETLSENKGIAREFNMLKMVD